MVDRLIRAAPLLWLRHIAAVAAAALIVDFGPMARTALAGDECGLGATVVCANDGVPPSDANPYAGGIAYGNANQTVTLASGVIVTATTNTSVDLFGTGTQTLNIASGVAITALGSGVDAVSIYNSASTIVQAAGSSVHAHDGWGFGLESSGSIDAVVGNVAVGMNNAPSLGARGITASAGGAISITAADVTVYGNNAFLGFPYGVFGITATSFGSGADGAVVIDTTGGTVTLIGSETATAVRAGSAGGPVTIKTGAVSNSGNSNAATGIYGAGGIAAVTSGAGAKVTIDSTAGAVTLTGTSTDHAIVAQSGGDVDIKTADVSTAGANAWGIHVQYGSGNPGGAVDIDSTAGTVSTIGMTARGISAIGGLGLPTITGVITVNAGDVTTTGAGAAHGIIVGGTGQMNVTAADVSTLGAGAIGINIVGHGTGGASVTARNITTAGNNAHGVHVIEAGNTVIDTTAGTVLTGSIGGGTGARGISIDKSGGAATSTVHAGAVETSGDNATGIHVYSGQRFAPGGGAITVTANSVHTTGDTVPVSGVFTFGQSAHGIDVFTAGDGADGNIVIDTSVGLEPDTLGSVIVEGRKARGIVARSGGLLDGGVGQPDIMYGGSIDITVGNVSTLGDYGTGIDAQSFGTGENGATTIRALGAISTAGANPIPDTDDPPAGGNNPPNGIYAVSWGGGPISVTTKDVSTVGNAAGAIWVQSGNGPPAFGQPPLVSGSAVVIDTTGGTISTKGSTAAGIGVGGSSGAVTITTGDIVTEGFTAYGISAGNSGPDSAMTIDTTAGKITTKGQYAAAIMAGTGSAIPPSSATVNAGLLTIRAGDITTEGEGAAGIVASANMGNIDITVAGALETGPLGSFGVSVQAGGTSSVLVTVDGSIATSAASAHGIVVSPGPTAENRGEVVVNGTVSALGTGATGIQIAGADDVVTVAADASVTGNLTGIRMLQHGVAKVVNLGTITGTGGTAVFFDGAFASTFENDGTVNGSVLLGAGDDIAILGSNSVIDGTLNGGGGTDLLRLTGAGAATLNAASVVNFESAIKTGAGSWSLTGTSAGFVPQIDVEAGLLSVNGAFANLDALVKSGATVGGGGSFKALTVESGGRVAPGNSIDTLTVASANFAAGSVFEVEIAEAISNPGPSDRLIVTGTAAIASGASVHVVPEAGDYADGMRYLILDAGTRSGAFGSVTDSSAFLSFVLDHDTDPNQVWLGVSIAADLSSAAETPNQRATAIALEDIVTSDPMIAAILPLGETEARFAFDQLSGEVHAAVGRALIGDSRIPREAAFDRVEAAFAALAAGQYDRQGPNIWARGVGGRGVILGDGNGAVIGYASGGLVVGADGLVVDNLLLGVEVGFTGHAVSVPDRSGVATATGYHLGVYGGAEIEALRAKFGASYSGYGVHVEREPTFPGFADSLAADYMSGTIQAFGEIGYAVELDEATLEPFVRLAAIGHTGTRYEETGGPASLIGTVDSSLAAVVTFGLGGSTELMLGDGMVLKARGRIGWEQQFGPSPTSTHAFAGGAPFTVAAPGYGSGFLADATIGIDLSEQSALDLTFKAGLGSSGARASVGLTLSGHF